MCERVQLERKKGWRMPANTKIVDRRTEYGNPYTVEKFDGYWTVYGPRGHKPTQFIAPLWNDKAPAAAIACVHFESYVWERLSDFPDWLEPLRGYNLACWCPDGAPCHAGVLLRVLSQYNPGAEVEDHGRE